VPDKDLICRKKGCHPVWQLFYVMILVFTEENFLKTEPMSQKKPASIKNLAMSADIFTVSIYRITTPVFEG